MFDSQCEILNAYSKCPELPQQFHDFDILCLARQLRSTTGPLIVSRTTSNIAESYASS